MSKNRKNIVYSTNPNYNYDDGEDELDTIEKEKQELKVLIDRKQRKGKSATLVIGFIGAEEDLKELGKKLKTKCGVGGSVKNNEILIQGELKDKVYSLLIELGYLKTKKHGG